MKNQRFVPSGCKDIGIRKFEFVGKTEFLWAGKCNIDGALLETGFQIVKQKPRRKYLISDIQRVDFQCFEIITKQNKK